jgi:signal transduction histidine kinase
MWTDRVEWPLRRYWVDIAWGAFAVVNLIAMLALPDWETVPFHFIWVSLTLLYGFRVWRLRPTMWTLVAVMVGTALAIGVDIRNGIQPMDEITEVPLMAAMFVAMMWHARRRLAAMEEIGRVSDENRRLLERERRFIQDASHELRTPITVALGQIELLERTAGDPAIKQDAAVAVDELMRLRRLAERLLLLASSEDPEFLYRSPTDVDALTGEALRRWASVPRRWEQGAPSGAVVQADAERLAMALDSLIENAVKHTDPGDRIAVLAGREGDSVRISVADSGTGIAGPDLAHLFDRFTRVDRGRAREAGGVGLGLSIVKAIAEAHGGSVAARSTAGAGTVFSLSVPAATAPAPQRRISPDPQSAPVPVGRQPP